MKRKHIHILLIVLFLSLHYFVVAFAQTDLPFTVVPESIVLEVGAADEQAQAQIVIVNGETTLTNLTFSPDPVVSEDGNTLVEANQFTLSPNEVAELAGGATLTVTISLQSLPPAGVYTGRLLVQYDQQPQEGELAIPWTLIVSPEVASGEQLDGENEPPPLELIITQRPGAPASDIVITMRGDATTITVPLYIRQPTEHEYPGVKFYAVLYDELGKPVQETSYIFSISGLDISSEGMTIPGSGRQVQVLLTVNGLSREGAFSGDLLIEYEGDTRKIANLTVSRFLDPDLKIAEAAGGGGINQTLNTRWLTLTLSIVSENQTAVDDLKIEVGDLTGTKANAVPVSWEVIGQGNQTEYTLPGLDSLELSLKADLPVADTYSGQIRLVYAGKSQSTALTVTRAHPTPSVTLHGLGENVQFIFDRQCSWWFSWLHILCDNRWSIPNMQFEIALEETAGEDVIVNLPELINFKLTGEPASTETTFDNLEIKDDQGNVLTQTVLIPAKNIERLKIEVKGLEGPGAYSGTLKITVPDAQPLEGAVNLKVKEPIWVAALSIFFSIVGSYIVRLWLQSARPSLARRENAANLLNRIAEIRAEVKPDASGRAEVSRVLDTLRNQAITIRDDRKWGQNADADATLQAINQKLALVLRLLEGFERVYGLKPDSLQRPLIPYLSDIAENLREEQLGSADEARTELEALPDEIRKVIVNALKTQIGIFKQNVARKRDQVEAAKKQPYDDILVRLAPAETILGASEVTETDIATVRATLEQETMAYITLVANELKSDLAKVPIGVAQDQWDKNKMDFETRLQAAIALAEKREGEVALKSYEVVFRAYLETVVEGLEKEIQEKISSTEGKIKTLGTAIKSLEDAIEKTPDDQVSKENLEKSKTKKEKYESFKNQLVECQSKIALIKANLDQGALTAAQAGYDETLKGYLDLQDPERGVSMAALAKPVGAAMIEQVAGGGVHQLVTSKDVEPTPELTLLRLLASNVFTPQRVVGDLVVNGFILIIAVVWGLNLMYINNPTWGTLADHIQVALWGFGLQQVGQTTFNGLQSFVQTNFMGKSE